MPRKRRKKKKSFSIDEQQSCLYNELRDGNDEAVALVESKQYQQNNSDSWVLKWWNTTGKANYLEEEKKISVVERYRELIESQTLGGI